MKLHCHKCKKILTKDLRPVKVCWKWNPFICQHYIINRKDVYETTEVWDEEYRIPGDSVVVRRGVFYNTPKSTYNYSYEDSSIKGYYRVIKTSERLVVGYRDILKDVVPLFKEGYGCCNWALGAPLKCECGVELGEMHLDCYEDGSVRFNPDKIERRY